MKILNVKRGDGYIDVVVAVMVSMMLIVLSLNVFSFLTVKQDMDYFAKEMVETGAAYGKTLGEVNMRYYDLADETGLSPEYSFDGSEYYNGSYYKVQLGDKIQVTLTYKTFVQGFGAVKIPITLRARYSGLSQKYWKTGG